MVLMMSRRAQEVPTNPATGRKYCFEMIFDGDRAAYAETYQELCETLVGYDPDRIRADLVAAGGTTRHGHDVAVPQELETAVNIEVVAKRIIYAVHRAVWLQALVNVDHQDEVEAMDEELRRSISGNRYPQPDITEWSHTVPLVLSQHDYAPYGPKPKPTGENIWWINPFTERSLIQSLDRIGDIQVFYRKEAPDPEKPQVVLQPTDSPPLAAPLLVTPGEADRMTRSMMAQGADFATIIEALDNAGLVAVLLDTEAMVRDDTRQLVGWLQTGDLNVEQFIVALAEAGISATVTGSYPTWAPES